MKQAMRIRSPSQIQRADPTRPSQRCPTAGHFQPKTTGSPETKAVDRANVIGL